MKELKKVALLGELGGEMPLQTGRTDDLQGPDLWFNFYHFFLSLS